jgi:plastocyanin
MRRHLLLVVGAGLIGIALVGGALQSSWGAAGFTGGNWFDHMSYSDHMGGFWTGGGADQGPPPIEGAREVTIDGNEFAFTPDELTFAQGKPVNVTFFNDGRLPHDFVVPELDIHIAAGPGQTVTIGITPEKAGVFSIVCTLPGHAGRGMSGSLVVEDAA